MPEPKDVEDVVKVEGLVKVVGADLADVFPLQSIGGGRVRWNVERSGVKGYILWKYHRIVLITKIVIDLILLEYSVERI